MPIRAVRPLGVVRGPLGAVGLAAVTLFTFHAFGSGLLVALGALIPWLLPIAILGALIALLLRTGLAGVSVLQLAQQLLDEFNGLGGLLHASANDLKRIKGLGPAKRAELVAVLELARRALAQQLKERTVFESPNAVKDFLQLHLAQKPYEVFAVLFLDIQNRMLAMEELLPQGTVLCLPTAPCPALPCDASTVSAASIWRVE